MRPNIIKQSNGSKILHLITAFRLMIILRTDRGLGPTSVGISGCVATSKFLADGM